MPNVMPTHDELIADIKAMESQGAQPQEIQQYLNKFKGQAPGQAMVIPQLTPLTPDQSAGALGSVTNTIIGGLKGFIQSPIHTGMELGKITAEAGTHFPGQAGKFFEKKLEEGTKVMETPMLQPQTEAEKIGFGAGEVAQFFTPAGAEKTLFTKGASYIDKLPELLEIAGKKASAITGTLKAALQGLISGGSMAAVTGAQTGGDVEKMKSAAELGAGAGVATGALQAFGPELSKMLNKADFKLSPMKEAKTAKIADQAAQFITDNKILGTDPTKYKKLLNINNTLEITLQKSLSKDVSVPKQNIIQNINAHVESLRSSDPAIYNQARTKADEAIQLLKEQKGTIAFTKGGTIDIKDALSGKRSWANMAFKLSSKGKIDPTVSNEGAYAVELAYQKALEDTLDKTDSTIKIPPTLQKMFGGASEVKLSDFNKVYSSAINAKNLTGIAQYKTDAGLFGRLFGLWVGKSIGQSIMPGLIGEIVGAGIGEAASAHLPAGVRNIAERGLAAPELPTTGARIIQGITTDQNP